MPAISPVYVSALLVGCADLSITASQVGDAAVLRAVPSEANTGDLVITAAATDRAAETGAITITTTRGGAAESAGQPAEVSAQVGDGDTMGWQDPTIARLEGYQATAGTLARVARYGGASGYLTDPFILTTTDKGDAAPSGDGEALVVTIAPDTDNNVYSVRARRRNSGGYLTDTRSVVDVVPADHVLRVVRVATRGVQAVMLLSFRDADTGATPRDWIAQYASDDGGESWYMVYDGFGASDKPAAIGDVTATDSGFAVAWFGDGDPVVSVITSPNEPIVSAVRYIGVGQGDAADAKRVLDYQIAIEETESGRVWCHWIGDSVVDGVRGRVAYSDDGGRSFTTPELLGFNSYGGWLYLGTFDRPEIDTAANAGGLLALVDSGGNPVTKLRLGGWTSIGQAPATIDGDAARLPDSLTIGWVVSWVSTLGAPEDGSFTETGSGNHARIVSQGMSFTGNTGSRATRSYAMTTASLQAPGQTSMRVRCSTDAAMDATSGPIFLLSDHRHASTFYRLRLDISEAQVRAWYVATGGTATALGAAVAHGLGGEGMIFHVRFTTEPTGEATVKVYGRTGTEAAEGDWSEIATFTGTATHNTDVGSSKAEFGVHIQTGETADFAEFWSTADNAGTPADEVPGRPLSTRWIAVPGDALIRAGGGTTDEGDSWTIGDVLDGSAIETASAGWVGDGTAAATVTIDLPIPALGPVVGICLRGLVADGLDVSVAGDGTTGVVAEDPHGIEVECAPSATYTGSSGDVRLVVPGDATATSFAGFVVQGEWDGYRLALGDKVERIIHTHGGRWNAAIEGRRSAIVTEVGATTIEAGTGTIWARDALVLVNLEQRFSAADKGIIRVTLDFSAASDWPAGTNWRLDRIVVGTVHLLTDEPGWGWAERRVVPADLGETPSGRINPRRVGPPRREVDISWQDGVDTSRAYDEDQEPRHVSIDNRPWGSMGETPDLLMGISEQIGGPEGEVVWIPDVRLDKIDDVDALVLPGKRAWIHGRIVNESIDTANVLGDGRHRNEVVRVGQITIREEV